VAIWLQKKHVFYLSHAEMAYVHCVSKKHPVPILTTTLLILDQF